MTKELLQIKVSVIKRSMYDRLKGIQNLQVNKLKFELAVVEYAVKNTAILKICLVSNVIFSDSSILKEKIVSVV